jgi:methylthioribulose-1-phosphate dehydratase
VGRARAAQLPIFANWAEVTRIAGDIEAYYSARQDQRVPALLIASHGITAWGADAFTANRHLEVTEFLCQLALAESPHGR